MHSEWLRNDDYQSEHEIDRGFTKQNTSLNVMREVISYLYNSKTGQFNVFQRCLLK